MNLKRTHLLTSLLPLAVLLCTGPTDNAGTGSQTPNSVVAGTLYCPDGSPADGATVRFISAEYTPSQGLPKALADVDSTTTDRRGRFALDLDSGTYNMLAQRDTLAAFLDSIVVQDDTVFIVDTLELPGSITGVSLMPGQNDTNQIRVTIYLQGTEFLTRPDVGGSFSLQEVPEGSFTLIFDPTLDQYGAKILTVQVTSGQATDLGTVVLYGTTITGMPLPHAGSDTTVSIGDTVLLHGSGEDTLGRIVSMQWDIGNTGTFGATETGDTLLIAPDTVNDSFICVFRITDNDSNASFDTLNVSVVQDLPLANAGSDTAVGRGDTIHLRGSGSTDGFGRIVTYEWDIGNTGNFIQVSTGDTDVLAPDTFRFDGYECVLRVTDDDGGSSVSTKIVCVGVIEEATGSAPFLERRSFEALAYDNRMWVIGGSGTYGSQVWYTDDGANWSRATYSAGFGVRDGHSCVVYNGSMWLIAGAPSSGTGYATFANDVWSSTDGVNWSLVSDSAGFRPRAGLTSVVFQNKMWVIGGHYSLPPSYSTVDLDDVWYSEDGSNWTQATISAGFPRELRRTSMVYDGKIWVVTRSGTANEVWCTSDGVGWTMVCDSAPFSRRGGYASIAFENKMWIISGESYNDGSTFVKDAWYSTDGVNWRLATDSAPFTGRKYHRSVDFNGRLWIMGGEQSSILLINDIWYFR